MLEPEEPTPLAERWLVRLLVTRDPVLERAPALWDWEQLLDGGAPTVLHAVIVGYETEEREPDE